MFSRDWTLFFSLSLPSGLRIPQVRLHQYSSDERNSIPKHGRRVASPGTHPRTRKNAGPGGQDEGVRAGGGSPGDSSSAIVPDFNRERPPSRRRWGPSPVAPLRPRGPDALEISLDSFHAHVAEPERWVRRCSRHRPQCSNPASAMRKMRLDVWTA